MWPFLKRNPSRLSGEQLRQISIAGYRVSNGVLVCSTCSGFCGECEGHWYGATPDQFLAGLAEADEDPEVPRLRAAKTEADRLREHA